MWPFFRRAVRRLVDRPMSTRNRTAEKGAQWPTVESAPQVSACELLAAVALGAGRGVRPRQALLPSLKWRGVPKGAGSCSSCSSCPCHCHCPFPCSCPCPCPCHQSQSQCIVSLSRLSQSVYLSLVVLPACMHACLPACLPACLRACVPACVPACLRARLPACVPACVSALCAAGVRKSERHRRWQAVRLCDGRLLQLAKDSLQ